VSPRKTDVAALARMVVAVVATEATPIQVEAPVEGRVGVEGRAGAERAVLTVRDAGPGSAPDLLARLFERFVAGPGSPDLGLRLFLARDIAEVHGGALAVESAPGLGMCVTLSLPVRAPPTPT